MRLRILAAVLAGCPAVLQPVAADPVRIQDQFGAQAVGVTFRHGDQCRLLSARHVLNDIGQHFIASQRGTPAPGATNLEVPRQDNLNQGLVDSGLDIRYGLLPDWQGTCGPSLILPMAGGHRALLNAVQDRSDQSGLLYMHTLRDDDSSVRLPVSLRNIRQGEQVLELAFAPDTATGLHAPERQGISGSGIYLRRSDGGDLLVAIVSGRTPDGRHDTITATRIDAALPTLAMDWPMPQDPPPEAPKPAPTDVGRAFDPPNPTTCDLLAASTEDRQRLPGIAGIATKNIRLPAASTACREAIRNAPGSPRLSFQLGRALARAYADTPEDALWSDAFDALSKALSGGHIAAIDSLEFLLWRDSAACGGGENCARSYMNMLTILEPFDPNEAAYRRGRVLSHNQWYRSSCGQTCDAEAARQFSAVLGPSNAPARAELAWLVLTQRFQMACPQDAGCRRFAYDALSAVTETAAWPHYWLGLLLRDHGAARGFCPDRIACIKAAGDMWQAGGEKGSGASYEVLARHAEDPDWWPALDCPDLSGCLRRGFSLFRQAALAGSHTAARELVGRYVWQHESSDCTDDRSCVARALPWLKEPWFAATPFGKSLTATAIERHTETAAELCTGQSCAETVIDLLLAAAEGGNAHAIRRYARLYHEAAQLVAAAAPQSTTSPTAALQARNCPDQQTCLFGAIAWYRMAWGNNDRSVLGDWLDATLALGAIESATLPPHMREGPLRDLLTQLKAIALADQPATHAVLLTKLGAARRRGAAQPCLAQLDDWCARDYPAAVFRHATTAATPLWQRRFFAALDCSLADCPPEILQAEIAELLERGGDTALSTLIARYGMDQTLCPPGSNTCAESGRIRLRDLLPSATKGQLQNLVAGFGIDAAGRPRHNSINIDAADALVLLSAQPDAGDPVLGAIRAAAEMHETANMQAVSPDDAKSWAHLLLTQLEQVPAAAERTQAAWLLHRLCETPLCADPAPDLAATMAMLLLGLHGPLPAQLGTDWPDAARLTRWIGGLSPAAIRVLQTRLGVPADGRFGPASWMVAAKMTEAIQETLRYGDLHVTNPTVRDWPMTRLHGELRTTLAPYRASFGGSGAFRN